MLDRTIEMDVERDGGFHVGREHTTCRRLGSANGSEVQTRANEKRRLSSSVCINRPIRPSYILEHWLFAETNLSQKFISEPNGELHTTPPPRSGVRSGEARQGIHSLFPNRLGIITYIRAMASCRRARPKSSHSPPICLYTLHPPHRHKCSQYIPLRPSLLLVLHRLHHASICKASGPSDKGTPSESGRGIFHIHDCE